MRAAFMLHISNRNHQRLFFDGNQHLNALFTLFIEGKLPLMNYGLGKDVTQGKEPS